MLDRLLAAPQRSRHALLNQPSSWHLPSPPPPRLHVHRLTPTTTPTLHSIRRPFRILFAPSPSWHSDISNGAGHP